MGDLVLLAIETDTLTVLIRGPRIHRLGSLGAPSVAGAVEAASPGLRSVKTQLGPATWVDLSASGATHPHFFEDTRYRLSVESRSGTLPTVRVRDPSILREMDAFPSQGLRAGSLNFGRHVGTAEFEFQADGVKLSLSVEVFPTKLNYKTDYHDVLHDIAGASRALALEYLQSTYQRGGGAVVDGRNANVEWLTIVRQEVESLELAMAYVDAHPHRALRAAEATVRADRIRRSDAASRRAVLRNQGHGPWVIATNVGKVRGFLPTHKREETLDTPEHRWLLQALRVVVNRLTEVHSELAVEVQEALERGSQAVRLRAQADEVEEFVRRVSRLTELAALQDVSGPPQAGFTSLTLLTGPGYSDAFRALTTLRLGLHTDGDVFDLSLKELSALYEAWCFIRIARKLTGLASPFAGASSDAIVVSERGLRVNLVQGRPSAIRLKEAMRSITLLYNPTYPGLTGDQRPDIVIEFRYPGWPAMFIVLDAKYRLNADPGYLRKFDVPGPPSDAINALHRYRDAIVLSEVGGGLARPVVLGAALYPLDAASSSQWPNSRLCEALSTLGIGAIPYLPSNTVFLDEWLQYLASLPPHVLARQGPPFRAWEAALARLK